ncbi:MAG TPA: hypothetical protein VKI44_43160 [Acetobacteraceae bacterium]|nr:hypothetical protein [Acetobacteraceae bacterium]
MAAARPPADLTGYDSPLIMVAVPFATPAGGGQTARAIVTLEELQAEETPATVLRRPAEGDMATGELGERRHCGAEEHRLQRATGSVISDGMIDDHVLSKPELRRSKPGRADFAAQARNPITVVLDGVHGNYNIGAIFRLCDAFLVERLIICGEEGQARPPRVPALLRKRKLVQAAWARSAGSHGRRNPTRSRLYVQRKRRGTGLRWSSSPRRA